MTVQTANLNIKPEINELIIMRQASSRLSEKNPEHPRSMLAFMNAVVFFSDRVSSGSIRNCDVWYEDKTFEG